MAVILFRDLYTQEMPQINLETISNSKQTYAHNTINRRNLCDAFVITEDCAEYRPER